MARITHWRLLVLVFVALTAIASAACSTYGSDDENTGDEDGDASQDGDDPADGDNSVDGDDPPDGDDPTDGDDPADGDQSADGDNPADGDKPDFPPGPYGYDYGSVMEDFALKDCDGNTVHLKDFYGTAKAILLNSSAGWCSVCRREAPTLGEWFDELEPEDVVFIQTLFENNSGKPANADFCKSWRDEYDIRYYVLVDGGNYLLDYHPSIQRGDLQYATPLNMVLDDQMRIQYVNEGDIPHTIYDRIRAVLESE
ncbi:MAG: TlpA family protein disulfide reductase [Myxococcales bacterium]|nr:MAG: TlpA family protein disulfide reductase [Myxococcales bacterium]